MKSTEITFRAQSVEIASAPAAMPEELSYSVAGSANASRTSAPTV
jgi:hypothetical protein